MPKEKEIGLDFEEQYGRFQDETSWYEHAGQFDAGELVYLALGLVGEAGEFADAVKKIVRETGQHDPNKFAQVFHREGVTDKLMDELGDTFWYLNKLLRFMQSNQNDLMLRNTLKLYGRLMDRPKANLMELDWPFEIPYDMAAERFNLVKDKDKDEV